MSSGRAVELVEWKTVSGKRRGASGGLLGRSSSRNPDRRFQETSRGQVPRRSSMKLANRSIKQAAMAEFRLSSGQKRVAFTPDGKPESLAVTVKSLQEDCSALEARFTKTPQDRQYIC